jgi:hypothetical protein
MQNLGMAISYCGLFFVGIVLLRGAMTKSMKQFPLFYSYVIYVFCGTVVMYTVYWLDRPAYPSAYWLYFLVSILVEFAVLVEISDHIFQNLTALRLLGRAITIIISAIFAIFYMLPVILWSHGRPYALLAFALRASVTKVVVLVVLFWVAHHFRSELSRNVRGLMLGFSLYLGVSVVNMAAAGSFGIGIYAKVLWIMTPASYLLCLIVWTIALGDFFPAPNRSILSAGGGRKSPAVALELARFNDELSKFLDK